MLKYAVLYQSDTGNTRQLAAEVFSAIPSEKKDLINLEEAEGIPDAEIYFIGFGVYSGTCRMNVIDCMGELQGKKAALFASCGSKPEEAYRKALEKRVSIWLEDDNEYLGLFLCQGKMPIEIRREWERRKESAKETDFKRLLADFDEAMLHPDSSDLKAVREFTLQILEKAEE